MKKVKKVFPFLVYVAALLASGSTQLAAQSAVAVQQYVNPVWAPPYAAGVRYYYFPDIEVYYDLTDGNFVYLDGAQWIFSPALPAFYSSFDLYGAFVVALDFKVYRPWMHHQFYVAHYPRYYYLSRYGKPAAAAIRGFNENVRQPFYRRLPESGTVAPVRNGEGVNQATRSKHEPQDVHYYGRDIGSPVKVTGAMRERGRGRRG